MAKPIYPKENILFVIAAIISGILWLTAIVATKGIVLVVLPFLFLGYLLVQSGFVSYLRGTGALVSDTQFPDIQQRTKICAQKIEMKNVPKIYILHGNGIFNAFATRFLRRDYIVLLSDVLDALEDHPEAINFYIGHEMGHIDRKHLLTEPFLSLALVLPLLGAGYSRAREYTCDQYGAACCGSPVAAQQAVALLAVGGKRYKTINIQEYQEQIHETSGFWMSFHELIASYPWLVKRFARISPHFQPENMPSRNSLAYLPAIFIPRLNILSLVIIYVAFFGAIAMMETKKMMVDDSLVADESYVDSDMPVAEFLGYVVAEVNSTLPEAVDDITTLNSTSVSGEDTFIYHYTVAKPATEMDLAQLDQSVRASGIDHWCTSPETQYYRDHAIKIIYRYVDASGQTIGDVLFDLGNPDTCKSSL